MTPIHISSSQNPRIKQLVALQKRRQRDRQKQTLVEGVAEARRALEYGVVPAEAYLCPPLLSGAAGQELQGQLARLAAAGATQLFEVTPVVFARVAYRGQSGGVLLLIPYGGHELATLAPGALPFLVVIEGAEKPGNVGALLRSADAAGVDGVILCPGEAGEGTDLYNPNVVRASLGTIFTLTTVMAGGAETIGWLREREIPVVIATPEADMLYSAADLSGPVAITLGSEARGLSRAWRAAATQQVRIPMHGSADSLNLATATALLLYEVVRQRTKPEKGS